MRGGGRVGQAAAGAPGGGALVGVLAGGRQAGRPEALPAAAFPARAGAREGGREGDLWRLWPRPWLLSWPCNRKSVVGLRVNAKPLPPLAATSRATEPRARGSWALLGRGWWPVHGRRKLLSHKWSTGPPGPHLGRAGGGLPDAAALPWDAAAAGGALLAPGPRERRALEETRGGRPGGGPRGSGGCSGWRWVARYAASSAAMAPRSSARARQTETAEQCVRMMSTTPLTRQKCIIAAMMSKSGSGSPLSR